MKINDLYHGDCLELMHGIPDGSIDMILADLPYGTTACHWDSIIPLEPLWAHYKRIIKPRGAIVLTGSQPFTSFLISSNLEWFKYEWIWYKTSSSGFLHAKNAPLKIHENVLVFSPGSIIRNGVNKNRMIYNPQFSKGEPFKKFNNAEVKHQWGGIGRPSQGDYFSVNNGFRYPSSVIEFANPNNDNAHPTQKPVALFSHLIRTYTNPGELVLDNTAGSGTTAIAAIDTGRDWICMEKDAGYFQIAQKRIAEKLAQLPLPLVVEPARPRVEQVSLFATGNDYQ